jgi:hypothetical protein
MRRPEPGIASELNGLNTDAASDVSSGSTSTACDYRVNTNSANGAI